MKKTEDSCYARDVLLHLFYNIIIRCLSRIDVFLLFIFIALQVSCLWLMLDLTPMDLSSLSAPVKQNGMYY